MPRNMGRPAVREVGGVIDVEGIIDQQVGATCGFEAVENVLQLYVPVGNDASHTHLVALAHAYGALGWDGKSHILDLAAYVPILRDYGIPSHWEPFSHEALIDVVWNNRVAIVLADGHQLDVRKYPAPKMWHTVVVTNLLTDPTRRTALAYVGIDSNFAGRQVAWRLDVMDRAARVCPHRSMLVTDIPSPWPHRSAHFVQLPDNRIVRMPVR